MQSAKWIGLALLVGVIALLWLGLGGKKMPVHELVIKGDGRELHFQVELAESWVDLQHGLMDRKTMSGDAGMLFYFGNAANVSMWMKDTLLPLDMLFISADGYIVKIAENAEPESEKTINSGRPVIAVLEINGGTARKLGIKTGDTVTCPPVLMGK